MKFIAALTMVTSLITTFVLIAMAANYGTPLGMHPGLAGFASAVVLAVGWYAAGTLSD